MSWVIIRNEDGEYAAREGEAKSYTSDILKARQFSSRALAKNYAFVNERVLNLPNLSEEQRDPIPDSDLDNDQSQRARLTLGDLRKARRFDLAPEERLPRLIV